MRKNLDISTIRKRLDGKTGPQYWRSLEELAETDEFKDMVEREFPQGASEWSNPVSRRNFLKLMGASLALGGLTGCTLSTPEEIIPYVQAPEAYRLAGEPLFYATAMQMSGIATGLLAQNQMGRPTKIEGNPAHPASLGSTDVFAQASILNMYDPDRSQTVLNAGVISTWSAFLNALDVQVQIQRVKGGEGLRILTNTVTSPAMGDLLNRILEQFPAAKWHQYEPVNRDNVLAGAEMAFGEPVNTVYAFDKADIIFSLDADFLTSMPGSVRYAKDFANKRRVRLNQTEMSRFYTLESFPTPTGSRADHRLPVRVSEMEYYTRALAAKLGLAVDAPTLDAEHETWFSVLAQDLQAHQGAGIIIAGDHLAPAVHALVHAINQQLGNVGQTITYTDPLEVNPVNQLDSLQELINDMNSGVVDSLLILDTNPVYTAPVDMNFVEALAQVEFRAHVGLHRDETGRLCTWHAPITHYLEMWGDGRAYDGSITLTQPLIQPLYDSHAPIEILGAMLGQAGRSSYDLVRGYWEAQSTAANFNEQWQIIVHDGLVTGTALPPRDVGLQAGFLQAMGETPTVDNAWEIVFRPDPTVWDGRFSNNGWMQELPKPVSKLTWDNAAFISVATAEAEGWSTGDMIELVYRGRRLEMPVFVLPGHADGSITVHLGYGRTNLGRVADGAGFNTYSLRTSAAPHYELGVQVNRTTQTYELASTQEHYQMEGRALVREGTVEKFEQDPEFVAHMVHLPPDISMFDESPDFIYDSYSWGMSVDLGACNGCNACVVACQAENNIPIVGKDQVLIGREMHWMRIDSYFGGSLDSPSLYAQPIMCQHCEQAPCELVCPVAATVHDSEGLNVMVYNRCVGTRYCSNNCPYKVRRFNFLQYSDDDTEILKLQRNPEVTVRVRGVMEKCSYCIQRISHARIKANNAGRRIQDGEVVTACQAACPSDAIVFGDINDPNSVVSQVKADPLSYGLLTELGTRPRTTYMAQIRNPHPELAEKTDYGQAH